MAIKLEAVTICFGPRELSDWEAASAGQRLQASKQAQLAAWELHGLSSKLAANKSGSQQDARRQGQALTSYLASTLLDRLQLTIDDIAIDFEVKFAHLPVQENKQ